jgi:prevent-host-death family protein
VRVDSQRRHGPRGWHQGERGAPAGEGRCGGRGASDALERDHRDDSGDPEAVAQWREHQISSPCPLVPVVGAAAPPSLSTTQKENKRSGLQMQGAVFEKKVYGSGPLAYDGFSLAAASRVATSSRSWSRPAFRRSLGSSRANRLRITRDTLIYMADVSIRELRNHGGAVVDRASRGEQITITRSGRAVAELRPVRTGLSAEALLSRWRKLPAIDPDALRADIDSLLDSRL